jgi:hypothetical protein
MPNGEEDNWEEGTDQIWGRKTDKWINNWLISNHPEGSLPCSQEPSNDHYPEPDQSNLYHAVLHLQNPF